MQSQGLSSFYLWYRLGRQIVNVALSRNLSYRAILGCSERKIFCIGRNKTGTTSLATALRQLGYRLAPQEPAELLLRDWSRGDYRRLLIYSRLYDAYQDVPYSYPGTFKVLDQTFPNARFILTIRDSAEEWYRSLVQFHTKLFGVNGRCPTADDLKRSKYRYPGFMWDTARLMYGVTEKDVYNREIYIETYQRHNREVLDHFEGRHDKLLVLNVKENDSYKRLAKFLGHEVGPDEVFPWQNKTW